MVTSLIDDVVCAKLTERARSRNKRRKPPPPMAHHVRAALERVEHVAGSDPGSCNRALMAAERLLQRALTALDGAPDRGADATDVWRRLPPCASDGNGGCVIKERHVGCNAWRMSG